MAEKRPLNPYSLPKSDEAKWEPFVLDHKRVLVMSDIHIPYHSIEALTAAFDYGRKMKPDAVLLNGDTIDFFGLSRYCKEPGKRDFASELEAFREFFVVLQKTFRCKIYFKLGNHEERYNHFLWMKAGELANVTEFKLDEIIRSRAEGIEVIGEKRPIIFGDTYILHGHELPGKGAGGTNIANSVFNKTFANTLIGHHHQHANGYKKTIDGRIIRTYSSGCLSELHPEFARINQWAHGFTALEQSNGVTMVQNKLIINGIVQP